MKIGELIKLDKDINVKTFGGNILKAKKGDRGFITQDGSIYLLDGRAQNKIITTEIEPRGIDYSSIAQLIFRRINIELDLGDLLKDNDIEPKDCIDLIESVIEDIF